MGIISWIVFGLIAGLVAKWIFPGKNDISFVMTIILGIVGAVVGGFLSNLIGGHGIDGFDIRSFIIAVLGSLLVLFVYIKLRNR